MQERYTRVYERMCEIGQKSFGRMTADAVAGEGRARGRGGRVRAGLEALLRRMEGLTGVSACMRAG